MNSLHSMVDSSQYTTASAGQALSFVLLDELCQLVTAKDGEVDFILMSDRTFRNYKALLRSQGTSAAAVTLFYALLGVAVCASSRIWAGLLDRHRNGRPLATLNALLGVATILPALTQWWPVVLATTTP